MAEQPLKYEDWEGVFDSYLEVKQQRPFTYPIYKKIASLLSFPNIHDWCDILLGATTGYAVVALYLNFRHNKVLRDALSNGRPNALRNVMSQEDFLKKVRYQLRDNRFTIFNVAYQFLIRYALISSNLLPSLWSLLGSAFARRRQGSSGESVTTLGAFTLLFYYILCVSIWSTFTVPISYFEHCLMPLSSPNREKHLKTTGAWFRGLWRRHLGIGCGIVVLLWLGFSKSADAFETTIYPLMIQYLLVLLALFVFITTIVMPHLPTACTPIEAHGTRAVVLEAAKRYGITVREIYVESDDISEHVEVFGVAFSKTIVVPRSILTQCDMEEIEALVVSQLGRWTIGNEFVRLTQNASAILTYALPVLTLLFNWEAIVASFGFQNETKHPFVVLILILGGAIQPFKQIFIAILYEVERWFQIRGDLQTVKRGYGKQLAKALIKLEKDKVDVVVADRWYLVAFDDIIQVFGDRLARLGWTGEEDFGTEKVNES